MNTNLNQNNQKDLLLAKRLVFVDAQKDPNEKTLAEEKGLEEPGKIADEDSLENIQKLIADIYTISKPDEFVDKYADTLIELGIITENDRLPDVITYDVLDDEENIESTGINGDVKTRLLHGLMKKFTDRVSEKGQREINSIPLAPGSEEVTKTARAMLLGIKNDVVQGTPGWKDEAIRYQTLADTVASLGLKKEELKRTNILTESSQALELQLKGAQARLKLLQDVEQKVKKFENETKAKLGFFGKMFRASPSIVAFGGVVAAGLILPPMGLAVAGTLGSVGIISNAIGAKWLERWSIFKNTVSSKEFLSIKLQKTLLKKGEVKVKNGDKLVDFYIPETPVDGDYNNNLLIDAGGSIDGRVLEVPEEAFPGSRISGTILSETKNIVLEKKLSKLEEEVSEAQTSFNVAKGELIEHSARVSHKKSSFMAQYTAHESKVKANEENLRTATTHLASLRARRITEESTGIEKTEYDEAEKARVSAESTLIRSREALQYLKQVKRVFDLNDKFAKKPVPTDMIEALYGESLNPELVDKIKELSIAQDKENKTAQEVIGKASVSEVAKMLKGFEGEERAELLVNINKLLRKVAGDNLFGKKTKSELLRMPEFRFLRGMEKSHVDLFKLLISVPLLTPFTRYPKGPEKERPSNLCNKLITMFDEARMLLERDEEGNDGEEGGGDDEDGEGGPGGGGRGGRGPRNPGEASEANPELVEKRKEVKNLLNGLKNTTLEHLKGVFDVLNGNHESLEAFLVEARSKGDDLNIPRRFGNRDLMRAINSYNTDECDKAIELIEYIGEHGVLNRLNNEKTGTVREFKDGTLRLKEKMAEKVESEANLFLATLLEKINNLEPPPANPPALKFEHIKSIQINLGKWLKGGDAPHDQKVLQDFKGGAGENFTFENVSSLLDKPERLELVFFSLKKLGDLIANNSEQLTIDAGWAAGDNFECNIAANQNAPIGAGGTRSAEIFFSRNYDRFEMRNPYDIMRRGGAGASSAPQDQRARRSAEHVPEPREERTGLPETEAPGTVLYADAFDDFNTGKPNYKEIFKVLDVVSKRSRKVNCFPKRGLRGTTRYITWKKENGDEEGLSWYRGKVKTVDNIKKFKGEIEKANKVRTSEMKKYFKTQADGFDVFVPDLLKNGIRFFPKNDERFDTFEFKSHELFAIVKKDNREITYKYNPEEDEWVPNVNGPSEATSNRRSEEPREDAGSAEPKPRDLKGMVRTIPRSRPAESVVEKLEGYTNQELINKLFDEREDHSKMLIRFKNDNKRYEYQFVKTPNIIQILGEGDRFAFPVSKREFEEGKYFVSIEDETAESGGGAELKKTEEEAGGAEAPGEKKSAA